MKRRVFIGVGSSVAPDTHVTRALERLDDAAALVAVSTFYRTAALERPGDPPFVNGVVEVADGMPPGDLKALLRGIEQTAGRRRGDDPFAPREIDLDLLLYGDAVSSAPGLRLPHPDVSTRRFVALPLLELAPGLLLPGSGLQLASVAASLPPYPMEPLPELTESLRRRFLVDGRRQG